MDQESDPFSFFFNEFVETPIPKEFAAPINTLFTALQNGQAVLLVKANNPATAQWLSPSRLEQPLLHGPLETTRLTAWPLLDSLWVLSVCFPNILEEPFIHLQLQLVRLALWQRLCAQWQTEHEATEEPPISILPLTPLRATEAQQNRIAELNLLLEVMLQGQLGVHFHPIVHLQDARICGYEALIRVPQEQGLRNTGDLLKAVEQGSLIAWFDLASLERCLQQAGKQSLQHLLFVNLDAEGIMALSHQDRPLLHRVYENQLSPRQIVIEITERQTVKDFPGLLREIQRLREDGFRLAVDDAGSGYSSLKTIADLRPDFIKIDRSLVRSLNTHSEQRSLVATLVRFASQIGSMVLGEGVETFPELTTLIQLGVHYAQGYLFGRPAAEFRGIPRAVREFIHSKSFLVQRLQVGRTLQVEHLKQAGYLLPAGTPLLEAARRFAKNEGLTSIAIKEGDQICGILMRHTLESQLRMARHAQADSLLATETVERWMESHFVCVPEKLPVEEAISRLTSRSDVSLETDLIVLSAQGVYRGVLPVRSLLEMTLLKQQNSQRHTNGLTGLPDRLVLEQALKERLAARQSTGVIRADIEGLKHYNSAFGADFGDECIRKLAEHLKRVQKEFGTPSDLLFHLGGDNFVMLTQSAKVPPLCYALVETQGWIANINAAANSLPVKTANPATGALRVVGLTLKTSREEGLKEVPAILSALENLLEKLALSPNLTWAVDKAPAPLPRSA